DAQERLSRGRLLRHRRLGLLEGLGSLVLHAVFQRLVALVVELLRLAEVFPLGLSLLDLGKQLLLELDGRLRERGSRDEHAGEQGKSDRAAHTDLLFPPAQLFGPRPDAQEGFASQAKSTSERS